MSARRLAPQKPPKPSHRNSDTPTTSQFGFRFKSGDEAVSITSLECPEIENPKNEFDARSTERPRTLSSPIDTSCLLDNNKQPDRQHSPSPADVKILDGKDDATSLDGTPALPEREIVVDHPLANLGLDNSDSDLDDENDVLFERFNKLNTGNPSVTKSKQEPPRTSVPTSTVFEQHVSSGSEIQSTPNLVQAPSIHSVKTPTLSTTTVVEDDREKPINNDSSLPDRELQDFQTQDEFEIIDDHYVAEVLASDEQFLRKRATPTAKLSDLLEHEKRDRKISDRASAARQKQQEGDSKEDAFKDVDSCVEAKDDAKPVPFIETVHDYLHDQRLVVIVCVVFIIFWLFFNPLPPGLSYFVFGLAMVGFTLAYTGYIVQQERLIRTTPVDILNWPSILYTLPKVRHDSALMIDGIFQGWMYELSENYDAEQHHASNTHSVYVRLDGTTLRLSRAKQDLSRKRSIMYGFSKQTVSFVHQRYVDMAGCEVYLAPDGLVRKRLWSKKYPICVKLADKIRRISEDCEASPESQDAMKGVSADKLADRLADKLADVSQQYIYLFAVTDRDKEAWFRQLKMAATGSPFSRYLCSGVEKELRSSGVTHRDYHSMRVGECPASFDATQRDTANYLFYMSASLNAESAPSVRFQSDSQEPLTFNPSNRSPSERSGARHSIGDWNTELPRLLATCSHHHSALNAFLSRLILDFFLHGYLTEKLLINRIRGKFDKIRLPRFIDPLIVRQVDVGQEAPCIRDVSQPYLDDRGLWFDVDVVYKGGFRIVIETKANLMKLKERTSRMTSSSSDPSLERRQNFASHQRKSATVLPKKHKSAITDSDEEDSPDSSLSEGSDWDNDEKPSQSDANSVNSAYAASKASFAERAERMAESKLQRYNPNRILNLVDRFASTKAFEKITENKFVKNAMEHISNTAIVLDVRVKGLVGVLSVNIPPPPSDRLWLGFRRPPQIWFDTKPHVGAKAVTVERLIHFIERRILEIVAKVAVLPNMLDLVIPIMKPGSESLQFTTLPSTLATSTSSHQKPSLLVSSLGNSHPTIHVSPDPVDTGGDGNLNMSNDESAVANSGVDTKVFHNTSGESVC